jgi:hypothetical protein
MEGKYHVVGYHLAISPKNYEIEFQKSESQFLMISTFDISRKDGCCIPFCCLFPRCERWKEVIDTFTFQNNKLTLQSSTAFGGLIT